MRESTKNKVSKIVFLFCDSPFILNNHDKNMFSFLKKTTPKGLLISKQFIFEQYRLVLINMIKRLDYILNQLTFKVNNNLVI